MTSRIVVNNIEADAGVSTVTFGSNISGTFVGSISVSGVTTVAAGSTSAPSITPTGDSNTGIFFPSADTIAFAEGGVEVLRIDSSGNLGIGTSGPTTKFEVGDVSGGVTRPDFSINTVSTASSITIGRLSSVGNDNTSFRIRDRVDRTILYTTVSTVDVGQSDYSSTNLTIKNGNLVIGTSGKGIDFSATANSSGTMTSELLSDYEEGTWTPSWCNSSGSAYGTITYNTRIGMYTKIGNIVYYDIHLITTSWGGTTGTAWVSGLPYAATNARYQLGGGGIFCVQGVDGASAISNLTTQIASSGTVVELYYQTASTGNNYNVFGTGDINETGTVSIRIGGFYFT